jgi:hypothetical protein
LYGLDDGNYRTGIVIDDLDANRYRIRLNPPRDDRRRGDAGATRASADEIDVRTELDVDGVDVYEFRAASQQNDRLSP